MGSTSTGLKDPQVTRSMKPPEVFVGFALAALGLAWSLVGSLYDLRSARGRLFVTLIVFAASLGVMRVGLGATAVPRSRRWALAFVAVLPWNGVLLSQLAYVGYFLIPVEVSASALLLRSDRSAERPSIAVAILLALITRAVAFVVMNTAIAAVRHWFPGWLLL